MGRFGKVKMGLSGTFDDQGAHVEVRELSVN